MLILPEILVLQLSRFGKRWWSGLSEMHMMVSFPMEADFAPFMAPDADATRSRYSLSAVVVHSGFMEDGHSSNESIISWMDNCR
jgi:ubiquitin C-terminal hydrolase